jgi:hypothetical protein
VPRAVRYDFGGNQLFFSTYLGGNGTDISRGLALDSTGAAYLVGSTTSNDLPGATARPSTRTDYDAYVLKLGKTSETSYSIAYSSYVGGSGDDRGFAIALDAAKGAYITGFTTSSDFPGTAGRTSGRTDLDAFVAKLTNAGSLAYGKYLGGSAEDRGYGIAVDGANQPHVTGMTRSTDFVHTKALDATKSSSLESDAFVSVLKAGGGSFVFSTYLGGSGTDTGRGIALDGLGNIYVTGDTASTSTTFPIVSAIQPTKGGGSDAFVTVFNPAGRLLLYSTFLGGSAEERGDAIAVDRRGTAVISGLSRSLDYPLEDGPMGGAGARVQRRQRRHHREHAGSHRAHAELQLRWTGAAHGCGPDTRRVHRRRGVYQQLQLYLRPCRQPHTGVGERRAARAACLLCGQPGHRLELRRGRQPARRRHEQLQLRRARPAAHEHIH